MGRLDHALLGCSRDEKYLLRLVLGVLSLGGFDGEIVGAVVVVVVEVEWWVSSRIEEGGLLGGAKGGGLMGWWWMERRMRKEDGKVDGYLRVEVELHGSSVELGCGGRKRAEMRMDRSVAE